MSILREASVRSLTRFVICAALFLLVSASLYGQTTIRVPEDQPTIQDAINIANTGDTVLVAPGTYFENLFFGGKAIKVRSAAGADSTVLDGGGQPITSFQLGEGQSTVLDGFTIRNGGTDGGIVVFFSSPTISNNIVRDNAACGIRLSFSPSAVVANNTISNNLTGCAAADGGAGITIEGDGAPLITGNKIINNGGDTNFSNGGGIGVGSLSGFARPVISNNTIRNNQAQIGGGIMLGFGANAAITQNLIVENVASLGGGIAISGASGSLTSNTIANNDGLSEASGIFLDNFIFGLTFVNNLIVGRTANTVFLCNTFGPELILSNNDIFAPAGPAFGGACPDATGANGNISADPLFVDPIQSNYHLQSGSPAIDQGTSAPTLLQNDFEGQIRVLDGNDDGVAVVDMGAYERTQVEFSPHALAFADQGQGTSATRSVTLTNRSSLTFRPSFELTGDIQDFQQSNDCISELAPGDSCTLNFTFTPQGLGPRSALLTASRFDGQSMQPLANLLVAGRGVSGTTPPPIELTISPPALDFAAQLVGTTSEPQLVFLLAPATLVVHEVTVSGPFRQVLNCGPAAPCHIEVTFTPTTRGPATGVLTIHSNAVGSPHTVQLTGIGKAPAATLSPTSLDFGVQAVGSTGSKNLTLTNSGDATLHISAISTSGEFSHSDTCIGVVEPGASCVINLTFTPTTTGQRSGTLTISSDSEDAVPAVTLAGRGAVPVVVLSPASLSFGDQRVGVTSAAGKVAVTNTGEVALHITGISVLGDFAQSNDCGALLAPGATCNIAVTFTPATTGLRTGSVVVSNNDPVAEPSSVLTLSGTGVSPVAGVSPAALVFGPQLLNTPSEAQAVILSNTGGAPLQVVSISAAGEFAQSNNCGTQLAAQASCVISVTFTPSATGARAGTLTVSSDGSEVPLVVSLSGTGVVPIASVSTTAVAFVPQLVNTASAAQTVLLSNAGQGRLRIFGIAASGDFTQTNACGTELAPGGNCVITVIFTPSATGERTGTLLISSDGSALPLAVSLSGTGVTNAPTLNPVSLAFRDTKLGKTTMAKTVILTANGPGPLEISSITASGDFSQTNDCPPSLAAGMSCTIRVAFTPSVVGERTGVLSVFDNGLGDTHSVSLSGTGKDVGNPSN